MPKAQLPTHLRGWIVALVSSFVGFMAGFATIKVMGEWLGG